MGKIVTIDKRVIEVLSSDFAMMRSRNPEASAEVVEYGAVAHAAAREVHKRCGPGLIAMRVLLAGVDPKMQRKWAQKVMKAA
ncbi:MAG: hypothetical protein JHD35_01090 [Sphingopyxis sp.]|nr:hypothetical protein [Sphingopyxis sp.]